MQTVEVSRKQEWRERLARLKPCGGAALWFGLSAAAGSAALTGGLAPFGIALCLGASQENVVWCCAGALLGSLLGLDLLTAARQAAAILAVAALRLLGGRRAAGWAGALGTVVYLVVTLALVSVGATGVDIGMAAVQSCLVLALAWFYRSANKNTLSAPSVPDKITLLVLWTSFLCCLGGLRVGGFFWPFAAVVPATLVLGRICREDRMPLLWTGAALACLAAGGSCSSLLVLLCAAWCGSQLFACRRVAAVGVAFGVGMLCLFTAGDLVSFARLMAVNAVGCGIFWVLPEAWISRLEDALTQSGVCRQRTPAEALRTLASGLEAVGRGVTLVEHASRPAPDDPNGPVEYACDKVCSGCPQNVRCWGGEYADTQDILQNFLSEWRESCAADFPGHFTCTHQVQLRTALLRAENLRVLRSHDRIETSVLRHAVSEQYRAVADGLYRLARDWQPDTPQPAIESRLRPLFSSFSLDAHDLTAVRRPDGALAVRVNLPHVRLDAGALEALAREVGHACEMPMVAFSVREKEDVTGLLFLRRPLFSAVVGVASCAAPGSLCADVVEQVYENDTLYLLLCDGMGTGRAAALDAKMAALFTSRLLRAGLGGEVAARLVNAALLSREEGDRGSTLDIFSFAAQAGTGCIYKAGACASYLVTAAGIRRLASFGLPVGSAEDVRDGRTEFALSHGDRVVMVTDGVLQDGESRLLETLKKATGTPQQVADAVMAACVRPEGHTDDCTVVVTGIERCGKT